MNVVCEKTLDLFRLPNGPCEWCGRSLPTVAAHVRARGRDNTRRMDLRINVCAICNFCHSQSHNGDLEKPAPWNDLPHDEPDEQFTFLSIVAARENCGQGQITVVLDLIERLRPCGRKTWKFRTLAEEFADLVDVFGAQVLFLRVAQEVPILAAAVKEFELVESDPVF